ncbi:uncharacterized protein G2W53_016113 [Senna tora]|uniref:Uncharacterized protein n=1 Tax=Senna tora TaxID=362788 RepID=A0A834WW07_9FABA|nr:uncharacterized protein G2W53_016113 [Senna tora]
MAKGEYVKSNTITIASRERVKWELKSTMTR